MPSVRSAFAFHWFCLIVSSSKSNPSFVLYEQLERKIFMLDTSSDSDYWVIYTKI
ncbi:hypothetical protein Bca101_077037 [Brassica carinata]